MQMDDLLEFGDMDTLTDSEDEREKQRILDEQFEKDMAER